MGFHRSRGTLGTDGEAEYAETVGKLDEGNITVETQAEILCMTGGQVLRAAGVGIIKHKGTAVTRRDSSVAVHEKLTTGIEDGERFGRYIGRLEPGQVDEAHESLLASLIETIYKDVHGVSGQFLDGISTRRDIDYDVLGKAAGASLKVFADLEPQMERLGVRKSWRAESLKGYIGYWGDGLLLEYVAADKEKYFDKYTGPADWVNVFYEDGLTASVTYVGWKWNRAVSLLSHIQQKPGDASAKLSEELSSALLAAAQKSLGYHRSNEDFFGSYPDDHEEKVNAQQTRALIMNVIDSLTRTEV